MHNVLRKKTNFKCLRKGKHLTKDCLYFGLFFSLGRLGQLGLKEGFPSAVKNISSVIGMFIQHARDEGNASVCESQALLSLSPPESAWAPRPSLCIAGRGGL